MGFCIQILIIVILSFTSFSVSAQVQEENNFLSIPDFTIHRVIPEKPDNFLLNNKSPVKKETPKHMIVEQPEKKLQLQSKTISDNKQNKQTEVSQKIKVKTEPKKNYSEQSVSKSIKQETEDTQQKQEMENNSIQPLQEANPDEFISKINKINEKNQSLSKGSIDKNNIQEEKGNDFLKTFSSLSIVLLLIFVFAWVYARVKGINPTAILTGKFSEKNMNRFNVLSTSTLGQGKDIHLVEINGKQLVIGSTANNINLLTEIPPEEIEKLKEMSQKNQDTEETEPVKLSEEDDFYSEFVEEDEFVDPEYYSLKYSEVYKDYIDNKEDKKDSEE